MEPVPDTFGALFFGYTAIWAIIVGYILSLAKRLKRIERELEREEKESRNV